LSADVVAVDGDPERDINALERVRVVIARGQLVRDNRPAASADQH
jgi:imidazolonepropionase-like amidohydrolase